MKCTRIIDLLCLVVFAISCRAEKTKDVANAPSDSEAGVLFREVECSPEFQQRCADVQAKIYKTQELIKRSTAEADVDVLLEAQLQLDELLEQRAAYQEGKSDISVITQRYQALRKIIDANGRYSHVTSVLSYKQEELSATLEVFKALGELYIDPRNIADAENDISKSVSYGVSKQRMPWAGYWYPKRNKKMFESSNSPMHKLDSYLNQLDLPSTAAAWEIQNFEYHAAEWEGMCDSWSMASISTLEPKSQLQIDGINFMGSDLKAIAIKYYEGYKPLMFGRRYQGIAETDGMIQDLRPEAFHRLVEEYIGKKQQPIIVDEDPGPEIWSKPLFHMSFSIYKDPKVSYALLVKAYPWMIRQRTLVDEAHTSLANDLSAPTYTYRLYYDAQAAPDGRLKIIAGEWLGASLNSHPDMVSVPAGLDNQRQINPEIKKYHSEIRKLLELAGMFQLPSTPEVPRS